jgi:hypothetical protein
MARPQESNESSCHGAFDARDSLIFLLFFPQLFIPWNRHKNAKLKIEGGDRRLPLGLSLFTLEKPQLENEEETYYTHWDPKKYFFQKMNPKHLSPS